MPHGPLLHGNAVIPNDPFALPAQVAGPVHFNGQQYGHLPQHLAQQLRDLPPAPLARGRGRGRGRGQAVPHVLPVRFPSPFLFKKDLTIKNECLK